MESNQCWWFSPGIPTSSTTKTGRNDIAEILLKVALNTKNKSYNVLLYRFIRSIKSYTLFMPCPLYVHVLLYMTTHMHQQQINLI